MKKIKLLYGIGSSGGGTLKNVADLATHLDRKSFEVFVAMSKKKHIKDTEVAISKMKNSNIDINYIHIAEKISLTDIVSFFKIYSFLNRHKFDIVHAHSSKAGALFRLAAFWAKVPVVVYTPHCFYFTACKGIKRQFYRFLECLLTRITHQIVISGTEQKAAEECKIRKEKISIIDNGIDCNEYIRPTFSSAMYKAINIPFNHTVIIGVGRLVRQKNWEMFIDIAEIVISKNKEITFLITGDGPCRKRLLKRISRSGLDAHIKLIGYVENISTIYSIADVFVSTSKWEGLPYTYLEASYFKIPMIITYTDGIEYFIQKGDSYIILESKLNFARRILETIPNHPNNLSANRSFPFTLAECIKRYEALYQTLLELCTK